MGTILSIVQPCPNDAAGGDRGRAEEDPLDAIAPARQAGAHPGRVRAGPGRPAARGHRPCQGHPDPAGRDGRSRSTRSTRSRRRSTSATRSSPSTTTCWSTSARTMSRSRALPTRWTQSSDQLSWTFHIRSGMKWSDGQPATSADVVYTYNLELNGTKDDGVVGLGYLDPYLKDSFVTSVTAPDPSTVVITSSRPTTKLTHSYIPILPQHIWKNVTPANVGRLPAQPGPVVGTGPYQAVESTSQYVRLVRNPYYWGKQGAADEVVIQYYPSGPGHDGRRFQERRARLHPQPECRVVQPAQDGPEHGGPGVRGQRLHPAQLQHLHQGRRRLDHGAPGPGLPAGPRLRD